jgi:hypothetical protein
VVLLREGADRVDVHEDPDAAREGSNSFSEDVPATSSASCAVVIVNDRRPFEPPVPSTVPRTFAGTTKVTRRVPSIT